MNNPGWTWVFVGAAWAMAAVGVMLLLWALFWDRSRGRRRCPMCWYDMMGVPGLRCPECGREARSERGLLRTRRRWRSACGAVVTLGAAYGTWCVPEVRAAGWTSIVPSAVLVVVAPPGLGNFAQAKLNTPRGSQLMISRLMLSRVETTSAGATLTIADALTDAAWKRLDEGRLAKWESQVFVSRVIKHQNISLASWIHVPARWPVDEAFPYWITGSGLPLDMRVIGPPPADTWKGRASWPGGPMVLNVCLLNGSTPVYSATVTAPITVAGTAEAFLDQAGANDDAALVRRALRPRLVRVARGRLAIEVYDRGPTQAWEQIGFLLHYRIDVEVDGAVVGSTRGAAEWKWTMQKYWADLTVDWVGDGEERAQSAANELSRGGPSAEGRIRLVTRGDTGAAARHYMKECWADRRAEPGRGAVPRTPPVSCWAGEFAVPVTAISKGMDIR